MKLRVTHFVPPYQTLTLTAGAAFGFTYWPHPAMTPVTTVAASAVATIGPNAEGSYIAVEYEGGFEPTVSYAKVDFLATNEIPMPFGTGMVAGDFRFYYGAGAPVDYTDGDPVATGEGEAGPGSFYLRTSNGKLYLNGGSKAQPLWKIVTSA